MSAQIFPLLHAGFDTLDVAFRGALSFESLNVLRSARDKASELQEPVLCALGSQKVAMHVLGYGVRGGYAFVSETGPLGGHWRFKDNMDSRQWNIFVSPSATALLAFGYHGVRDRLHEVLSGMGARVTDHSINRVDFAMDFRSTGFELRPEQFVAHSHTKLQPYWSAHAEPSGSSQPSSVVRGRRVESVTIGKMPGRQLIVYDKRREAIERRKRFWFERWGLDPTDRDVDVWRVEVRLGKKHLKGRWNIRRGCPAYC